MKDEAQATSPQADSSAKCLVLKLNSAKQYVHKSLRNTGNNVHLLVVLSYFKTTQKLLFLSWQS